MKNGGHLGSLIEIIIAYFDLQVCPMFPTKFQVNWSFGSGEATKTKIYKMAAGQNDFSYFDLQITTCFLPGFKSIGISVQKKKQIKFSRRRPWRPFRISDRNDFGYFLSTSHTDASYRVPSQLVFRFWRRSKKYIFKMF